MVPVDANKELKVFESEEGSLLKLTASERVPSYWLIGNFTIFILNLTNGKRLPPSYRSELDIPVTPAAAVTGENLKF
jgi:hypothetical protein